jgi:hypothetical protein
MKTVVFRAHLLLGDAIYASAVIGRYVREHPEDRVVVECLDEYPKEIYQWIPGSVETTFETDTVCDVRYEFDVTAAMHDATAHKWGIWKSLGSLHGLPADDVPVLNIPSWEIPEQWKSAYVISPFSRSCTSHQGLPANKTLPTTTWMPLIRYLRRRGPVLIVGSHRDRMTGFSIDESERVAGESLAVVASVFRTARCVISVDNGLARLSTLTGANTVTLMPEFLPLEVFVPAQWANSTSRVAQVDMRMDPGSFTASMKFLLRQYAQVI